jgi:hypothetical protein
LFGVALVRQPDLHQLNFRPQTPSHPRSKLHAGHVTGEEENTAFLNANLVEFRHACADELTANAALPMAFRHREMMQITAPAIVAAQHGTDDPAILFRDET